MVYASLSPLEQKLYFSAKNSKNGIISLDIIKSWKLTDVGTLLSIISKMVKKGWLIRLRRGVYLINEPGMAGIKNPFLISTYMFPGYNAFLSALYLYGLTDMVPFEIQIATRNARGLKRIGEYSFRGIPIGKKHLGSVRKEGNVVSSLPKTIYDCLVYPELAGGYPSILRVMYEANMDKKTWEEVFYYAELFERNAFFQRLGYLLDILPEKNREVKRIIKQCLKKVKSTVYLRGRKKGRYIKKWKVIDNVGRERLLSWWYKNG